MPTGETVSRARVLTKFVLGRYSYAGSPKVPQQLGAQHWVYNTRCDRRHCNWGHLAVTGVAAWQLGAALGGRYALGGWAGSMTEAGGVGLAAVTVVHPVVGLGPLDFKKICPELRI